MDRDRVDDAYRAYGYFRWVDDILDEESISVPERIVFLERQCEQDWDKLRDEARQHIFRRLRTLGITNFDSHIKFEEIYTPLSWRKRYNLMKGSTHGLAHTLTQLAYFRPSNRHPRYSNLYSVGASTHPGTGMPTAMVSGRLVSKRIIDDLST